MKLFSGKAKVWMGLWSLALASVAGAQLRVATYNISNYSGGRTTEIATVVYGTYQGRQFAPDVLCVQEIVSASALTAMKNALNAAPGSPGDWQAATFISGPDTQQCFLYRTSKVHSVTGTTIAFGSSATNNQPRNTYRFDFKPVGYAASSTTIAIYNSHMKAGADGEDQDRRLIEAQRIRDNAETLPPEWNRVVLGDFNIQTHTQAAYVELVGTQPNNIGRFYDPVNRPASWNNNGAYSVLHTQDPAGSGGMDDRLDFILMSNHFFDGAGMEYIGNRNDPLDLNTWNDPSHSYRVWGNDGTSYNSTLRVVNNLMVGPTIAQELIDICNGGGHLPVYLDVKVPAKVTAPLWIDFGHVPVGRAITRILPVGNGGDTALWSTSGIANLTYSLSVSSGPFTVPGGSFADGPGGSLNGHPVTFFSNRPGKFERWITVTSNDPEAPATLVRVTAYADRSGGHGGWGDIPPGRLP